ncbi:MAG: MarR family transcriptional regulator [Rhodobacteraceae bacterium]|nr:MarR family transcriptional regulator [Paracoccaceae bacterium]
MNFSTQQLRDQMQKLSQLNGHLTYRITKLSKLLEAEAILRLKGTGVNLTSYRIMLVVSIFEEITVSDLARLMVIDRAQVSRLATEMTKQGLLTSKADKSNKLKKLLMLTEEGHARYGELREAFQDRAELITQHATEEELEVLWGIIERVNHSLSDRLEGAH